jgi:sucrose-6-phosphate hydrolase SacC (GH32 family)
MKWKKLGKIFDPTNYTLANNCVEFAQSPQALVFDTFVRIYFSTREKDIKSGKYLSHISYVDMDKNFETVISVSDKTVIKLGELGCFDEHGIFPINVVRDKNRILAYTCGWSRRVSVSVETSTGLAISNNNGLTFQKVGNGPVMSSSLHEPFLVGDSFVCIFNDRYHMWYIYGERWVDNTEDDSPARVYKIAHAISDNGIDWKKEGTQLITDKLNADECQALPTVIFLNNKYHMYFCYRQSTGFRKDKERGYRIGYAYSDDLINWTRDDENSGIDVTDGDWDSDMMCYPHIFHCNNKVYLLYNGNEFGRFGFGIAVLENDKN